MGDGATAPTPVNVAGVIRVLINNHDVDQRGSIIGVPGTLVDILPDNAREVFGIPEGYEAWTGIAIGYEGDPATLPDNLKQRDLTPRQRKPLKEFVFTGRWGNPAPFLAKC